MSSETTGTDLGEFLRSRRARLSPQDVGLASYGARRVPGLRREELAQLAGVSLTYYTRLEQGQSANASESVIDAIGRALNLSDDERAHLHNLARPRPGRRPRPPRPQTARSGVRQLVAAMTGVPAVVMDRRSDVLAWNRLGHLLLAGHYDFDAPDRIADRPNLTRMLFCDPHTADLYPRWKEEAARAVASLRLVTGTYPDDRELAELVGELSVKSREFAGLWSRQSVQNCMTGTKQFRHPEVGPLELDFELLHLPDGNGSRIITYTAAPGTPSDAALRLLAATAPAQPAPGSQSPSVSPASTRSR